MGTGIGTGEPFSYFVSHEGANRLRRISIRLLTMHIPACFAELLLLSFGTIDGNACAPCAQRQGARSDISIIEAAM